MSTVKTNTLSNAAGSKSVPVDTVVSGTAKAWVNFNGTGTVAIRASFNVSSITDNGTGNYTVNLTTAMSDANYSASCTRGDSGTGAANSARSLTPVAYTTTSVQVVGQVGTGSASDAEFCNVTISR